MKEIQKPDIITPEKFNYFTYSKNGHFELFKKNNYDRLFFGKDIDIGYCDLKVYQDLLAFSFIRQNIKPGSRVLEIGGAESRILKYFSKDFECWNLDKLEGIGNGPTKINSEGFRLVSDYIGNFNQELPENYFDLVFSISTFEHIPIEDEALFENIRLDIERLLKKGGLSFHCIDHCTDLLLGSIDEAWTNPIIPYFFKNEKTFNKFIPLIDAEQDPDLFFMSEKYYEDKWQSSTNTPFEKFGKPFSYNILWEKKNSSKIKKSNFPKMTESNNNNLISKEKFNDLTYSKTAHFKHFHEKNYDFELFGKRMNPEDCSLLNFQELLIFSFIKENVTPGSRLLDIGIGYSRILNYFKTEFECWHINEKAVYRKVLDNDLKEVKIVKESIGNVKNEVSSDYFDFVFSISAHELAPENDASNFDIIFNSIERVSKENSYNFHCFDVILKEDYVWSNKLLFFFFSKSSSLNEFISFEDLKNLKDAFFMSEAYYDINWKPSTNKTYKDFGKPLSYNIIWQKEKPRFDLSVEFALKNYKKRLPIKTQTNKSDYLKNYPIFVFHHLIKCGGTSVFNALDKWFQIESDYKPAGTSDQSILFNNINMYNKYKLNTENFNPETCLVAHFDTDGYHLHQRYPEVINKKDRYKIFTFVREPLDLAISLYYYKYSSSEYIRKTPLRKFLSYHYNLLSIQFPCNETNYMEVLDKYFFIGLVEDLQESLDKLGNLIGKKSVNVPVINKSVKDSQIEEILKDSNFIVEYKKRNKIDYLVYEYCKEKYYQTNR